MPSQDKHKRKRQDEIVLQPVDSLKLMFEYLDIKFLAIQDQIDQKYWEPPRKRTTTMLLKVKVVLCNSDSTLDCNMILRTPLTTKIATSRPLKL